MSLREAAGGFARTLGGSGAVRVSGWILVIVTVAAIVGPSLSPHDYRSTDFDARLLPPTLAGGHFFGTDDLGRDLFVRTLSGTRVTLLVAVVASFVSLGVDRKSVV